MSNKIIVKEFFKTTSSSAADLQEYLNGANEWFLPIKETDIIDIKYSVTNNAMNDYSNGSSGILLTHIIPT